MMEQLENEILSVRVSDEGAQLCSVFDKRTQTEHLWQGDVRYWREHAPNLFPYIARLTDGKYTYQGQTYEMKIHGFAKYRTLSLVKKSENELVYELTDDEQTRAQYPFAFAYRVHFILNQDTLSVIYEVENRDTKTMHFAVGGHPGFHIPFREGGSFETYYLEVPKRDEAALKRVIFSDDCFVLGEEPYEELKDGKLFLKHELFDNDAVVLTGSGNTVVLTDGQEGTRIRVTYPGMPYIGFWHKPHTDAPYVCIEPWSSLPSRKGVTEDLETQENLLSLEAGKTYQNRWDIAMERSRS